jgi:hypothetical protein
LLPPSVVGRSAIFGRSIATNTRRDIFNPKVLHGAKVRSTFTVGGVQKNCSRNSRSGAFSLSRVNTISKRPLECGAQRDASTDTTAVQLRCSLGAFIGEN